MIPSIIKIKQLCSKTWVIKKNNFYKQITKNYLIC